MYEHFLFVANEIIFCRDKNYDTFLHCAAEACLEGKLEKILEVLPTSDLVRLMALTNKKGMTPLHYAVKNREDRGKDFCVLSLLLRKLEECWLEYPAGIK